MNFPSSETTKGVREIENKDKRLNLPTDSNTLMNSFLKSDRLIKHSSWKNNKCHEKNVEK